MLESMSFREIVRTLIYGGIGAFIVVEGWSVFLGVKVFSLLESLN